MGTLRRDDGGERPSDNDGLPGLPPEWGTIVIPDDAAELDHEASLVKRQLRRRARLDVWRRRFRLPPPARLSRGDEAPALRLPMLIMSIAIIATLASLFAIAWPNRSAKESGASHPSIPATADFAPVPDITLHMPTGTLRVRDALPAVVLVVDGCGCSDLIDQTAQAAAPGVTVLVVAHDLPTLPSSLPAGHKVVAASDEDSRLRSAYGASPLAAGVIALLIKNTGEVVAALTEVQSVASLRGYLSQLS